MTSLISGDGYQSLLNQIYDTALDQSEWVGVMENIADVVSGNSAWLSRTNAADGSGSRGFLARGDPIMPVRYDAYYGALNPYVKRENAEQFVAAWRPSVTTDRDRLPKDVLTQTEYYNDFMRPQHIHSILILGLAKQGLDISALTINRPASRGDFTNLELAFVRKLHPHICRAYRLGGAFSALKGKADTASEVLDQSHHSLFVVDRQAHVVISNAAGEKLLQNGGALRLTKTTLSASRPHEEPGFQSLIAAAVTQDPAQRSGGSMLIGPSLAPLCLTVTPVRSGRFSTPGREPAALICVIDPRAAPAVPEQSLREMFKLTGAEIRVLRCLVEGQTPREISHRFEVGLPTVRSQIASILAKTGSAGQAELSRKMTRLVG